MASNQAWKSRICILIVLAASLAQAKESLPPPYREWLDRDVAYIITHEEREAFLKLASNADRDNFIERFWEIRNPAPGAPTNEFREEHYRRLKYADQFFGHETGTPGWRTDRGRIYVELGPPQQKAEYLGYQQLRPMEIWFYQSPSPALPPYFYVIFYRPDLSSDFKLYSPYIDGPEKLVTTEPGSRAASLNVIDRQAGREVARTALSLLPDEPVDMAAARASLQSDVLLSQLRTWADLPLNKERLRQRREILESVTHRVLLGNEFLDALAVPLRDSDGTIDLHYLLRLRRPEDFAIGKSGDGRYYYAIDLAVRVLTTAGKPIFTDTDSVSRYLSETQFEAMKNKALAFEGVLPLAPGRYKLQFTLTNKLKQTAFRAERDVVVPALPASGIVMTEPVAFSGAEQVGGSATVAPFSVAGVRFEPELGTGVNLVLGQDLQVFYQLWQPAADPNSYAGKKILVEYGYGRPGIHGDSKVLREEVSRNQFDAAGSLLTGKKLPISDLPAGNYRLSITVTDPESAQKTYGALSFRISRDASTPTWYVSQDNLGESMTNGVADYHRALCYMAAQDGASAKRWLKSALTKDPRNARATAALVQLYFDEHADVDIADMFRRGGIDGKSDEMTVLRTAESLDRSGRNREALSLLESALAVDGNSGPIRLALAAQYKRAGDLHKAEELERQGKILMASPPQ